MRPLFVLGAVASSATAAPMLAERIAPQLEAQIEAATAGRIAQIDAAVGDGRVRALPGSRLREQTHEEQRAEKRSAERSRARRIERRGRRR